MYRETKFRYVVQHEETGYITSKIFTFDEIEVGCVNEWLDSIPRYFVVSKDQFTGLYDKNGTSIYEGDRVRCWGGEYYQGYWEQDRIIEIKDMINDCFMMGEHEFSEVIGNIYESPELIEGGTLND